jgi:hypothetical protein
MLPDRIIDWYIQVAHFANKGYNLEPHPGLSVVHLGVLVPQPSFPIKYLRAAGLSYIADASVLALGVQRETSR